MITGAESLLAADRVVLLGEMHGTRQVPEAVVELARAYDGPLRVGIEWPPDEQASVDGFMSGRALDTATELWRSPYGVTSEAMVAMLHALRSRADTQVFCFRELQDDAMAELVLRRYDAEPHAAFVVLAGNVHTQTRRASAPYKPMGEYLVSQAPVVAFDTTHRRGTAWCHLFREDGHQHIGVNALGTYEDRGDTPFVRWFDRPDDRGYDGELYLGDVDASPPY